MSKSPKQLWYSDHKPQKHRAPTYRGALPQTAIEDVKLLDVPALPVVVRGMAESPPVREVVPLLTSSPTPFTPHIRIEEVQSIELKAIEPKTPCRRPGRSARESAIILGSLPRIPLTKTFTEDLLAELKSDGPQRAGTGGDCRKPSDSPRKRKLSSVYPSQQAETCEMPPPKRRPRLGSDNAASDPCKKHIESLRQVFLERQDLLALKKLDVLEQHSSEWTRTSAFLG